jgi:hypothetical protein
VLLLDEHCDELFFCPTVSPRVFIHTKKIKYFVLVVNENYLRNGEQTMTHSKEQVLLDPSFRHMANIFTEEDLRRLHAAAEVLWARDEPMPEAEIDRVAGEISVVIAGSWRYGDVARFPKLRAILEVGGGFPSPQSLDYAACFARGIRVLSCAPAFGPAVAEMGLGLALACARQIAWTDRAFRRDDPNWSHTHFETEIGTPFTLYGKQVGLIGFGGLARSLQPLLAWHWSSFRPSPPIQIGVCYSKLR